MSERLAFFLNDLRDGPGWRNAEKAEIWTPQEVHEKIDEHQARCEDITGSITRQDIGLSGDKITLFDMPLTEHALDQVFRACGIDVRYGKTLAEEQPDLAHHNIGERWEHKNLADKAKFIRLYKNGEAVVRGVLSDSYGIIDSHQVVKSFTDRYKEKRIGFTRFTLTANTQSFQAIDIDGAFDIASILGNGLPGAPSSNDMTFMGFDLRNSEVGGMAARLLDYIWRLICMNGSIASSTKRLASRKIHRKSKSVHDLAPMFGEVRTVSDWHAAIMNAAVDRLALHPEIKDPTSRGKGKDARFEIDWKGPLSIIDAKYEDVLIDDLGVQFTRAQVWDHMSKTAHEKFSDNTEKRLGLEQAAGDLLFDKNPLTELVAVTVRK